MLKDIIIPILGFVLSPVVAYYTATYAIRREQAFGRLRFLEICRRYLINFYNAYDKNRQIKSDPLAHLMYTSELQIIIGQLDQLVANAYFGRLVAEQPSISQLLVQLRRELIEIQASSMLISLNPGSILAVDKLYQKLRDGLPSRHKGSQMDTEINKLIEAVRKHVT